MSYTHNRKLGNHGNMSLTSNSDNSYYSRFRFWFKRKKKNFWDFWVFDFALYPRSKTRKSRKFGLPQILTLLEIQDLKAPKNLWIYKCRYNLEQKKKISEVSEFSILPYTQDRKLGNLRKFSFSLNFDSSFHSRFKMKMNWDKIYKDASWFKKKKTPRFSSFSFFPKKWKLGNLGNFCFIYLII